MMSYCVGNQKTKIFSKKPTIPERRNITELSITAEVFSEEPTILETRYLSDSTIT